MHSNSIRSNLLSCAIACHPEPFAVILSEAKNPGISAQGKLREGSRYFVQGKLHETPPVRSLSGKKSNTVILRSAQNDGAGGLAENSRLQKCRNSAARLKPCPSGSLRSSGLCCLAGLELSERRGRWGERGVAAERLAEFTGRLMEVFLLLKSKAEVEVRPGKARI